MTVETIYITKADFILRPYPMVFPIAEEEICSIVKSDDKEFEQITIGWTGFKKKPKNDLLSSLTEIEKNYHGQTLKNVGHNVWEYKGAYYRTEMVCGRDRVAWRFLPGDFLVKCSVCGKFYIPEDKDFLSFSSITPTCEYCKLISKIHSIGCDEEEKKEMTKEDQDTKDIFNKFFNGQYKL